MVSLNLKIKKYHEEIEGKIALLVELEKEKKALIIRYKRTKNNQHLQEIVQQIQMSEAKYKKLADDTIVLSQKIHSLNASF